MQWCSEEVSEDSGAESVLTNPGTLRKGKTKTASVSIEILKFLEYLSSPCRSLQPCTLVYVAIQQSIPFPLHSLYTSHTCCLHSGDHFAPLLGTCMTYSTRSATELKLIVL